MKHKIYLYIDDIRVVLVKYLKDSKEKDKRKETPYKYSSLNIIYRYLESYDKSECSSAFYVTMILFLVHYY
jgi:hypothetical protein